MEAVIFDTLATSRRQLGRGDEGLDEDGHSLGKLYQQMRRCPLVNCHSAEPDARGAVGIAACQFDASGYATFQAFLDEHACRCVVGVVEIVVEDTTSPEGSLTVRMGAQGAEALQAAWDGSRELNLNQGLDLCFDNGNQILYWKSDARDKMLKDTDAALHSGETRAIKDYEGALPAPGASPFASRGFNFPVPDRCDDPVERERRWLAAFAQFKADNGWDLLVT